MSHGLCMLFMVPWFEKEPKKINYRSLKIKLLDLFQTFTWNSLPVNLGTARKVTLFEKMLKTFLFDSAPPPLIPRRTDAQLTT